MAETSTRIAVVDDDLSVRRALCRLLRSAAFEVESFSSSAEFLDAVLDFRPCCIVLDLHMPGLSGCDVQRQLACIGSQAPVVIITGHDSARARAETIALGASQYLTKPVDDEVLVAAIRNAVASGPNRKATGI
jgi:FixJ family two-component response regulator